MAHDIEEKLEDALVLLLTAQAGLDSDVFTVLADFSDTDIDDNQVAVGVTNVQDQFPEADNNGYVVCMAEIEIRTHAETQTDGTTRRAFHRDAKEKVVDVLYSDSFITDLNDQGISGFTAFYHNIGSRQRSVDENSIITTQNIEVVCAPTA